MYLPQPCSDLIRLCLYVWSPDLTDYVTISRLSRSSLTLRAHDGGAALVVPLLDGAVLADRLDEGADVEVAHEHLVVARAVQARLVRHDLFALRVVLELVIATCNA